MTWSIYNIDFYAFICHGDILGQDCDSAFSFQIVVVENQLAQIFRLADQVRLINHPVHKGGFAVIHVGDNCYVSDFLHIFL